MFRKGDKVEITEIARGGGGIRNIKKHRKGRVVQVCRRFAVVDNGKYRECIWTDRDESNNPVMRRVSR